ncbi:MAG: SRPBCC family protein [Phycisphaerales bacterium]
MDIQKDQNQDLIKRVVELSAPVARVWRALTDHAEFGAWFRVKLDGPFVVGEVTRGNITYPGHEHMEWESLTEVLEHERRFVFSWPPSAIDPETAYSDDAKVVVEFVLESIGDERTRLTITESGFVQFPESKRAGVLQSCAEGWGIQAQNIAEYLDRS